MSLNMTSRVQQITLIFMTLLTTLICPSDSKILVTNEGTKKLVNTFQDKMLFNYNRRNKINWADKTMKNYLIHADPPNACYDVKPPPTLQFKTTGRDSAKILSAQVRWILLASDSDCGLIEKETLVKKAGYSASAIIIYNERTNKPLLMARHTQFLQIKDPLGVSFVGANDGHILKRHYAYPKMYTITFEENADVDTDGVPRITYNPQMPQPKFPQKQPTKDFERICSQLGSFKKCCFYIVKNDELTIKLISLICIFLLLLFAFVYDVIHNWITKFRRGPTEPPISRNAVPDPPNTERGGDDDVRAMIINWLFESLGNPNNPLRIPMPELESFNFQNGGDFYYKHCVICLEDFDESEELSKLPCTHYFHKSCISDWFERSITHGCPLCRTAASETNLDRERLLSEFQTYFRQRRRPQVEF